MNRHCTPWYFPKSNKVVSMCVKQTFLSMLSCRLHLGKRFSTGFVWATYETILANSYVQWVTGLGFGTEVAVLFHQKLILCEINTHRKIMPLRTRVACATWCHSSIYQRGERRRSRPLYTVAAGCRRKTLTPLCKPLSAVFSWCQYEVMDDTLASSVADSVRCM